MVKVRNWWALASASVSAGAAQRKPTFQPVRANILPAEPIFTQRSRMPGKAISGRWLRVVEHHLLPDLVADGDGVVAHAELGQQGQVLVRRAPCRRG